MESILSFENINIDVENQKILHIDNFELYSGELVFIGGNSGSGKTIFLKYVSGLLDFYNNINISSNITFNKLKFTYEEFSKEFKEFFFIGQDVENYLTSIFCEDELIPFFPKDSGKSVKEFLLKYNKRFLNRKINTLSHGELQELVFFVAYLSEKQIIVLDEPFARIDSIERKKISKMIKKLRDNGKTVIISGHGIELFLLEFDRLFKIKDKNLININKERLIFEYKSLRERIKKVNQRKDIKKILSIEGLNYSYDKENILKNIYLDIFGGSILNIIGKNGSGKTTLAKILSGIININKKRKILKRKKVIFIGSFPDYHFLFENLGKECESFGVNLQEILNKLKIDIKNKKHENLSFGQKMRLLMYLYSFTDYEIYIFDESFSGQDMESIEILFNIFKKLKDKGKSVILISQDRMLSGLISDKTIYLKRS